MAKLSFLLGAAAGYVLGARAGRQRYEQIRSGASRAWQSQPVQKQVSTAKYAAKTKAVPAARDAVSTATAATGNKLREGADKVTGDQPRGTANGVSAPSQCPSTFPLGEGPDQPA